MRIAASIRTTGAHAEAVLAAAKSLAAEHGEVGTILIMGHGAQPPAWSEWPRISAVSRELRSCGPHVGVLLGLRPIPSAMLRTAASGARALGYTTPLHTELEAAAAALSTKLRGVRVDDVLALYEDGARRLLVRPR